MHTRTPSLFSTSVSDNVARQIPAACNHSYLISNFQQLFRTTTPRVFSAREWCDAIMDENASNIRMQKRTRDRVKNKINRKFRHMKLSDLCHMSGNDYNAALLMAVPPEERAVLLAEAGGDTDEEDDEENMP